MLAIINFEFLLSPALSSPEHYEYLVDDIRLLSELIRNGSGLFLLEEDAVMKMAANGLYPSENIFQKIVSQLDDDPPYGAADVVRMLNGILSRLPIFSIDSVSHLVDWTKGRDFNPEIDCINDVRKGELYDFYENVIIENSFSSCDYRPLYYSPAKKSDLHYLQMTGEISSIYPDKTDDFPMEFNGGVNLFLKLDRYFGTLDGYYLYKVAITELDLKLSFYVGALNLIRDSGSKRKLLWDDFDIGRGFIKSLQENDCYQEQQFSSTTYDVIINILAGSPKNDINFFYKSLENKEPRSHGDFLAQRTHITKSGRALRLLMWNDFKNQVLVFANVGNKQELFIEGL
ncbi:TPA: hypothetical protein ACGB4L_002069 [Serratia marcescens]